MSARRSPAIIAGILVLVISLALLAWGAWPVHRSVRQADLRLPAGGVYDLSLHWPAWMRLGDPGLVQLVLQDGEDSEPVVGGTNRLAESRLEAGGLIAVPSGEILEPLLPGRQAIFYWSVLPGQVGEIEAVAWVSLHSLPAASEETASLGSARSQLLTAQKIPIRTVALLGLSGRSARFLGGLGVVVGIIICLEGFLSLRKCIGKKEDNQHA
jgi:hypothetical protein